MDPSLAHVIAVARSRFAAKARIKSEDFLPRLADAATQRAVAERDAALGTARSPRRSGTDSAHDGSTYGGADEAAAGAGCTTTCA